jgi:hypothetical protein
MPVKQDTGTMFSGKNTIIKNAEEKTSYMPKASYKKEISKFKLFFHDC